MCPYIRVFQSFLLKRETIRSDEIDFTGYGYGTANGRPRGRETYASLRVAVVVGIGASDPPVLLFATSGSTFTGPPPAKPLSSLQPDADASECPPMRIHMSSEDHTYTSTCTWIMNGKEWKKKGIPGRGFSKAPRSEWSAGDTSPAKPWNISAPLYSNTIGLTEFCVGECIASNLQMNFSSTASMYVLCSTESLVRSRPSTSIPSSCLSPFFSFAFFFPRQRHGSF